MNDNNTIVDDLKTFFKLVDEKYELIDCIAHDANKVLSILQPFQRIEFFEKIMKGYCKYCGSEHCSGVCMNDE